MRVSTIPAGQPLLDRLAERWRTAHADPSRGLLILPTRRAARALADSFTAAAQGAPQLLPRIVAIGGMDEGPMTLTGALDLPPAVPELERVAALANLVHAYQSRLGGSTATEACLALARELAVLMDETEQAGIDLRAALTGLVPEAHAAHWATTVTFLKIVTDAWPEWLASRGLMNPAARAHGLLRAQAEAWRDAAPAEPVWVAGVTSALPAVAALLRVVAELPGGCVILPGLDLAMDEAAWDALGPGHPQAGMRSLLAGMGARRDEVEVWDAISARGLLLGRAMLPPSCLDDWDAPVAAPEGLFRLTAPDARAEATAVAMVLRDTLEHPGARAALVTPDRVLAVRVAAELARWGIVADDSAGEPLAHTPPGVFLRLLAAAVDSQLSPVALLSLLKHPLAAAGLPVGVCRSLTRRLERRILRGPAPPPGFTGLRLALGQDQPELTAFVEVVRDCLVPALRPVPPATHDADALLTGLLQAAEALARTDESTGASRLWAGEEGVALAELLAEALPALKHLPPMPPSERPGLLDALLEGAVAHGRRALRGRDVGAEHPRVFIWGLLEARLQSVDVVVLGGLAEGTWPPATDPGPWMSRPMRADAGLPDCEEAIGRAAHDFVQAACCAPVCVLSAPARRDGAPVIEARWLARLSALLRGALPVHPSSHWAEALDAPLRHEAVHPPHPCPPVERRPTQLSVTDVEALICDPYAIYARRILDLRELEELEQETDFADYGKLVHAGMSRLPALFAKGIPINAEHLAREALLTVLKDAALRPALVAWWAPRFARIADWVVEQERARTRPERVGTELKGEWSLSEPMFTLTARVDRIEWSAGGVSILDYKTGSLPALAAVRNGGRPQLPLEAVMAEAGAFGADFAGGVETLEYWKLSGTTKAGETQPVSKDVPVLVAEAREHFRALTQEFAHPERTYPHIPHPERKPQRATYAQLAREGEVAGAEDSDE